MTTPIHLRLNRQPSILSTYVLGLFKRRSGLREGDSLPKIIAQWPDFRINKKHLNKFFDLCGFVSDSEIPITYPNMITFALQMSILTHGKFPLSYPKMMMIRNHVLQHRSIYVDEKMDICCELALGRNVQKGLEIDFHTVITIAGETVWQSINTNFFPGFYGDECVQSLPFKLEPITDRIPLAEWFFPSGKGWAFARISYDYNGLHYASFYARLNGFKRDFVHGQRILTECVRRLHQLPDIKPMRLDVVFKGPTYYDSAVVVKGAFQETCLRFDLYCGDNPRPCICGNIAAVKQDSPQCSFREIDGTLRI